MSRPQPARVTFRYRPRDGKSDGLGWRAECPVKACKFGSWHPTHNGAHIAKARHNRLHAIPGTIGPIFDKIHTPDWAAGDQS